MLSITATGRPAYTFGCVQDVPGETALENWQGKKHAYIFMAMPWTHSLDVAFQCMTYVWEVMRSIPSLSWKPDGVDLSELNDHTNGEWPELVNCADAIAKGRFDAYILAWSALMRTWLSGNNGVFGDADDRRAFVSLLPEGNLSNCYAPGNKTYNGNNPTVQQYISAYRHVVKLVRGETAIPNPAPINSPKRLQWGWMTNGNGSETLAASIYPGADVVDWVGLDGYTACNGKTPSGLLGPLLAQVGAFGKPMWIDQVGCKTRELQKQIATETDKTNWINDFFSYVHSTAIQRIQWWNIDGVRPLGDWAVFRHVVTSETRGDEPFQGLILRYRGYSAYRIGVQQPWIVGYTGNSRILSDSQFLGQ